MSLLVWLPLKENLKNLGSANATVTNNGATIDSTEKCYYFNRSAYMSIPNPFSATTLTEASLAFWVKIPETYTSNQQIIHVGSGSGWVNNRFIALIHYGTYKIVFHISDGTNTMAYSCESSALTQNEWTHVACTYSNRTMKIYVNGVLDKTYSSSYDPSVSSITNVGFGAAPNGQEKAKIYLFDARIYDHCLSELEVKKLNTIATIKEKGLQIWLPLNGDLTQQGLSNASITNVGATVDNSGKMGKCYSFDGSDDGIRIDGDILPQLQKGDFSICFWAYSNDAGDRSIYIATTPASDWGFSIEKTTGNKLRVYWQGNPDFNTTLDVPNQQWCHIAVVIKNGNCYCYKNGEKLAERTSGDMTPDRLSRTWIYAQLGRDTRTGSTVLNGKMNDFRWYDYALSEKEVKELAKGLVLHYPLNRGGCGQENLLHNTHDFNGRSASNTTIVTDNIDGTYAKTTPSTVDWTSIQIGPSFAASLISGKTITVTCKIRAFDLPTSTTTNYCYLTLNAFKSASSFSRVGNKDHPYASNVLKEGEWVTLSYQLNVDFSNWTVSSGYTTSDFQYITLGLYNHSGKRIDFRHPKLELGSIATPWCPNSSDILATTMGLNSTTEYDCSGFCNNGTRMGTFSWTSDTPKYQVSTKFDTTSTKIKLPAMSFTGMANSYTFAWWQYNTSTGNMPWGFSDGNRLNCYHCSPLCWNTGDGSSNQFKDGSTTIAPTTVQNGWHHMVVTGDGTATKLYIDGVYRGTATTYKALTGTQIWVSGWDSGTSYTFNGSKESDFRIYATALSADDIAELYNGGVL